jgi:hypothetical protein
VKEKIVKTKAEKMINVPTALFIDTQYYCSQGLKFTTSEINALKKQFKSKSLRLILPAVAYRELEKKFGELADETAQIIHSASQKYPINLLKDWAYAGKDKSELRAQLLAIMEQEWKQFQRHFKVVRLTDNGNLERVIDWYFEKKPPFGEGKKAKEFPDAIMVSALDKYCAKHKAKLAVISRDGDFKNACASRPQFIYFESLPAYLEKGISEQTIIQHIHKLLKEREREFRSGIEQRFEKTEFTAGQAWEHCASEIQNVTVEISEQSIIELEATKFTVVVAGTISFEAHVELSEYSPAARQYYETGKHDSSSRIHFRATVKMKADAEFKEIEDYLITQFSPESVFIDNEQ